MKHALNVIVYYLFVLIIVATMLAMGYVIATLTRYGYEWVF